MNKYLLRALCFITLTSHYIHAENNVNGLELVISDYTTSILDLPLKNQVIAIASGLAGGACTLLVTRAVTTIFQAKRRQWNAFDPKTYTWVECGTGPLGALWTTKFVSDYYKPEAVAEQANKNGLLNVILENENIVEALDAKFLTHHFPRATAFAELVSLRNSLTHLLELLETYNTKKQKRNFNTIKTTLRTNLKQVDNALLLVKQDPRWYSECNAYTLQRAQATQQTQQNAEFAGAAIRLAHAYASAK